jgi:hypothetical protein
MSLPSSVFYHLSLNHQVHYGLASCVSPRCAGAMTRLIDRSSKRAKLQAPTPTSPTASVLNHNVDPTPNSRIQLPNGLIDVIMNHFKENGNMVGLASVAQCSRTMYDIVIPKLYETIIGRKTIKNNLLRDIHLL